MHQPLITVGIPVYNAEKYLAMSIKSVLKQTYTDFKLIIVNDGSCDQSLEIIRDFIKRDSRIDLIHDGENKGLIARLNEMINQTDTEFFVRMDADDIMFSDRLEKQLKLMQNNPDTDVCHSSAISIDKHNQILGIKKVKKVDSSENVLLGSFPIHPSVMGKTEFFKKNLYRQGFYQMEDMELWYRTANFYKFEAIEEPLLFYREDSYKNSQKHKRMYLGLQNFVNEYIPDKMKANEILKESVRKRKIYSILEFLNLEKLLLRRRYDKIDNVKMYNVILNNILN